MMKRNTDILFKLVLAFGFAHAASAQTCASPLALSRPVSALRATGSTCKATNAVTSLCGSLASPQPDVIYSLNLVDARTATTIFVTNNNKPVAGFTPSIVLYRGGCAAGAVCMATGQTSMAMDVSKSAIPSGTYYLAVTSSPGQGSAACGDYALLANGTLPVTLQSFSVD